VLILGYNWEDEIPNKKTIFSPVVEILFYQNYNLLVQSWEYSCQIDATLIDFFTQSLSGTFPCGRVEA
jgi:hypothetical protein